MFFSRRPNAQATSRARGAMRRNRPSIECLETRQLLSATATLSGGVLTINADNASNNQIAVSNVFPNDFIVVGTSSGRQFLKQKFDLSAVKSVVFNGGTGANSFTNNSNVRAFINGHGKGDILKGGNLTNDVITSDSSSATIDGNVFGRSIFAATSDLFINATDTSVTTRNGTYTLKNIHNMQIRLAGPLASNGGGRVSLEGYTSAASVVSEGAVRTDFQLGSGPTSIVGSSGLNVVSVNNVNNARVEDGKVVINGVSNSFTNVTNLNIVNAGGTNIIDLAGFAGNTFVSLVKPGGSAVRGGSGVNSIVGGAANTFVLPSVGTDVVTGSNITRYVGLSPNPVPLAQRSAVSGPATVFLKPGGVLDIVGPTGAGFSLVGNWSVTTSATAPQSFSASGNVVLKTPAGDIPFVVPAASPLIVHAQSAIKGFGNLVDASLTGLTIDTTSPSSPLNRLETVFGLHLAAGGTWSIALGKDLPGGSQMPLSASVPYLFSTFASGATASFGTQTVTAGNRRTLTAVLDPSDPSLYVQSDASSNFRVGTSLQGDLKFTPNQRINGNPPVFGNLFSAGTNPFRSGATIDFGNLRALATGDAVINFDVNRTTNLSGVTPDLVQKLLAGQIPIGQALPGGLSNVSVGVNGSLRAGYTGSGFAGTSPATPDFDLTFASPIASVALASNALNFATTRTTIEPGYLTNKASSVAFVGQWITGMAGSISDGASPAFNAQATLLFDGNLALAMPDTVIMGITSNPAKAGLTLSGLSAVTPGFGRFGMSGSVQPNGDLILNGTGAMTTVVSGGHAFLFTPGTTQTPIVKFRMDGNFGLTFRGAPGSATPLSGAIIVSINPMNIPEYVSSSTFFTPREENILRGAFNMEVFAEGTTKGIRFKGSGTVTGTLIEVGIPGTKRSPVNEAWQLIGNQIFIAKGGLFTKTNSEFILDLPSAAFPGVKLDTRAGAKPMVTLSGRISEPSKKSTWTLTINWGDGSKVQRIVFPKGSHGRRIAIHHRYRNPAPAGKPFTVVASWQDDKGTGNSELLQVQVKARRKG